MWGKQDRCHEKQKNMQWDRLANESPFTRCPRKVFLKEGSSELGPGGQKDPRAQWGRVRGSDSLPMHQNHREDLLNIHHWALPLESESMNLRWGSENFPVERVPSQHRRCWADNHTQKTNLQVISVNIFTLQAGSSLLQILNSVLASGM